MLGIVLVYFLKWLLREPLYALHIFFIVSCLYAMIFVTKL